MDLAPFALITPDNPDWSQADQTAEFARYCQRQKAIQDCLDGIRSPDEVLELLSDHSVDVDQYLAEVSQNVAAVLSGKLII
jgi:hypothetical protein